PDLLAPLRPPLADLTRERVLHLDDGLLEVVGRALGAERGTGDVDGGLGPVRPRGGEVPVTPRRVLHLDLDGDGGEVGVAEGAEGGGVRVFDGAAGAAGEREGAH